MEEANIAQLTEKFDDNIKIIKLYNTLIGDLNEIPEAVQYEEAKEWLKQISEVINEYINSAKIDQSDNINILENSISSIRKFSDLFKGGKLSKPILDIAEFHDVLNKCGFDLPTKVEIKKIIGKTNYDLVFNNTKKDANDIEIDKYQLVYDKKIIVYNDEINKTKEIIKEENINLEINNAAEQIDLIINLTKLPYKNIQNAVVCILLKQELDLYNKELQNVEKEKIIKNLEELLIISRKQAPKLTQEEEVDSVIVQASTLIEEAEQIIHTESNLVKSIEDMDNYYKLAITDSYENNKITLSIIVDSIKQNSDLLKNIIKDYIEYPDIYERKCKELILNISEYIETYNIIKKRMDNPTNLKKEYKIIYLTNSNNQSILFDNLDSSLLIEESKELKEVLAKLQSGEQVNYEKDNNSDYKILKIKIGNFYLIFMLLKNDVILILNFAVINNYNKILVETIELYRTKIDKIIKKSNQIKEINLLIEEQVGIRMQLEESLKINIKQK